MKALRLIIPLLVVVMIIAVGVLAYATCAGTPIIQKIDKTLPDSKVAPYQVLTATKLYLSQEAVDNGDGSVTMNGWYVRVKDKWIFHEEAVTLPPVLHPKIERR